jgi:cytochrome c peroxidase
MSLAALEPLPSDPTNRVADDPRAAAPGERLLFDTRLSSNGLVACGPCHRPEHGFQDGMALAVGVGTTARRTMPIAGAARSPILFWDGRRDPLWAQALGPLESAVEHGKSVPSTRTQSRIATAMNPRRSSGHCRTSLAFRRPPARLETPRRLPRGWRSPS